MEVKFKTKDYATANIDFKPDVKSVLGFSGNWDFKCYDGEGSLKWTENVKNLITAEGLNNILNVQFHNDTQISTWYMGLKSSGVPASGDSLASHASWAEFTSYENDRQEFKEGESTTQSIGSSAASVFSINGAGTVDGAFLSSVATGSDGTLFSAVDFDDSRTVASGDQINCSYTITSADV